MKNNLTFKKLSRINKKRCEQCFHSINDWSASDWATALAGEVGEACNIIKKIRRLDTAKFKPFRKSETKRDKLLKDLKKELGDIQCYLDLLATYYNFDLAQCTVDKFNEVSKKVNFEYEL